MTRETSIDLKSISPGDVGISIANPGSDDNTVTISIEDASGALIDTAKIRLSARHQFAKYVTEIMPRVTAGNVLRAKGTRPFGIAAIATSYGKVRVLSAHNAVPEVSTPMFPLFAMYGGWGTEIVLFNESSELVRGSLEMYSSEGSVVGVFPYSIEPGQAITIVPGNSEQ